MEKLDVSVLIYTHDSAETLPTCLAHLEHQTFPAARFEVIILDDGSTDNTPMIVERFASGAPVPTRCLRFSDVSSAKARNQGAREARGRWLIFLDDELLASPQLVERHVRAQETHGGRAGIIGNVVPHPQMMTAAFTRWVMPEESFEMREDEPLPFLDWRGANISISKDLLLDAGGLDESFAYPLFDDAELGWRLGKLGVHGYFAPAAYAYIWRQTDFAAERRRHYAKGYALHRLARATQPPPIFKRYRVERDSLGNRFETFMAPFWARMCMKANKDSPLFMRLYRRVLRYDLYHGFQDARRGRPPRESAVGM